MAAEYNIQPTESALIKKHNDILAYLEAKGVRNVRLRLDVKQVLMQMSDTGAPIVFDLSTGNTTHPVDSIDRRVLGNEVFFPFGIDIHQRNVPIAADGRKLFGNSTFSHFPDAQINDQTDEVKFLNTVYNGTGELKVGDTTALKIPLTEFYLPNGNNVQKEIPTERTNGGNWHYTSQTYPTMRGNLNAGFVINLPSTKIAEYGTVAAIPEPGVRENYIAVVILGYVLDTKQPGVSDAILQDLVTSYNADKKFCTQ